MGRFPCTGEASARTIYTKTSIIQVQELPARASTEDARVRVDRMISDISVYDAVLQLESSLGARRSPVA